jgi:hypothetical protein
MTRGGLLVYPADVGARHLELRGPLGRVGVTAVLPVHLRMATGFPVLLCDPKTGQLVERLNLLSGNPQAEGRFGVHAGPELRSRGVPLAVQFTDRGLVAALDGQAWGRSADVPKR